MARFNNNLSKILANSDPTEGLVNYVQTVKPYHSKILEVLVEHIVSDDINVSIAEKWEWIISLRRPDIDTVYNCGHGLAWGLTTPNIFTPPANIISATVGSELDPNSNSFLIEPVTLPTFGIAITDVTTSTFTFATHHTINMVDDVTNTWFVSGDLTSILTPGDKIYVNANTGGVNGKFTVASLTFTGINTEVTVNENITSAATDDGEFSIPLPATQLPTWMFGVAVKVTSTQPLQSALASGEFHFSPTDDVGEFHLTTKRHPTDLIDFVHVEHFGNGQLFIQRNELFVPWENITVEGSFERKNNGRYTVLKITEEAPNLRVHVLEKVCFNTPSTEPYDGRMRATHEGIKDSGDFCLPDDMADFHAETYIDEKLIFEMTMDLNDELAVSAVDFNSNASLIAFLSSTASPGTNLHTILPRGYDCQGWGVSSFDETFETVPGLHNGSF